LQQMMLEDPALGDDPECNLAYGVALTALAETADALAVLEKAAAGFAARGDPRQTEALEALAQTWAVHNEWERTPARFNVPRPAHATAARATRRAQIEALRSRISALPNASDSLARLNLVLGRYLLCAPETADEGRGLLRRLTDVAELTPAGCQAALTLATDCEQRQSWGEAVEWYRRVAVECVGEAAAQARQAVERLTHPDLLLDVPTRVSAGQPLPIRLRVRGLESVRLEVRQVDVEAWLSNPRTRGSEAGLPESGSIRLSRDLVTRAETAYAWWNSASNDESLECLVPPGAYVVLASGRDADGQVYKRKHLVIVSDLLAVCVTGRQRVLAWAGHPGADGHDYQPIQARFWMNRSFAPVEVALMPLPEAEPIAGESLAWAEQAVANFRLPAEAAVLRDKGWVCLLRCGEHLAVCRGEVASLGVGETLPRVALLTGPPGPGIGESFYAAGFLLPGETGEVNPPIGSRLELTAIDALERVKLRQGLPLLAGGVFGASLRVDAGQAGEHLRVLTRLDGQSLWNVLGRPTVSAPRTDERQFRVRIEDVPVWLPADAGVLRGTVRAEYPWGAAPLHARARCVFDSFLLPLTGLRDYQMEGQSVAHEGRLDVDGQWRFELPLSALGLSDVPLAIHIRARVTSLEGREGAAQTTVLVGASRPHAWLTCDPSQAVAHQPLRFICAWVDPAGAVLSRPPTVSVRRDGAEVTRLPLRASPQGFVSMPWEPEPGLYEAVVTLDMVEQPPLTLRRAVTVQAVQATAAARPSIKCSANLLSSPQQVAVRVTLSGEHDGPVLALLARSEPLAASALPVLRGQAELTLPLEDLPTAGLRVAVLGLQAAQARLLAVEPVEPDPSQPIVLALQTPRIAVWPGERVTVKAVASRAAAAAPPTVLIARLTLASRSGFVDPAASVSTAEQSRRASGLSIGTSLGEVRPDQRAQDETTDEPPVALYREIPAELAEGMTLWCASLAVPNGVGEFEVPVPERPGCYRLIVVARSADGAFAAESLLIDARQGITATLSVPRRMRVGDRVLVALELENAGADPRYAEVRWELGDGLSAETMRVVGSRSLLRSLPASAPARLELPAGSRTWLHMEAEAARIAAGEVAVEVRAEDGCRRVAAPYEVADEVRAPGAADLTLHRRVFVWTKVREGPEHAHGRGRITPPEVGVQARVPPVGADGEEPGWDWVPWQPTDRLVPGQLLKVRDELELRTALAGTLSWSQDVPPTCHTVRGMLERAQSYGLVSEPDRLRTRLTELKPGLHAQEYFLAVVRPGVGELPAPRLQLDDQPVGVQVNPQQIRLVVVGRP